MSSRSINIVYSDNGAGLTRDALVLADALKAEGHKVSLTPQAPRKYPLAVNYAPEILQHLAREVKQRAARAYASYVSPWEITIFLERLVGDYLALAGKTCLFPHQEWLTEGDRQLLPSIDLVCFKTRHAMDILDAQTKASRFVGWTSPDRRDASANRRWDRALHISGWNPHKGTETVARVWSQHPEWPKISIVSQLPLPAVAAPNVELLTRRVDDQQLQALQNECGIHVCPSEVEGFGHTLVEAMSCGGVVITTDAPPMNELVTPDEGFLVPYATTIPMQSGIRYMVDDAALAEVLERVWRTDAATLRRMGDRARARYESGTAEFRSRLAAAMVQL
jgi:glycosyltransferase involved in cell wall biosynthesis